jgi:hypothetical protein
MSISAFSGPVVSFGTAAADSYDSNPEAGTSLFYNGAGILDPRPYYGYNPGQDFGSDTAGWLGTSSISTLNVVPYTISNVAIAAAAVTVAATPMTLVSANSATTGVSVAQSITRADTGSTVTGLLAIDGHASISGYVSNGTSGTAGNILTVTTAANGPLIIGMVITGTGIATGTYVTGYGPTTSAAAAGTGFTGTYTVSTSVAAGTSGSPITITANLGSSTVNALNTSRIPFGTASTIQPWNPQGLLGRAVSVTAASVTSAPTFTVSGYDIYGFPMSEVIQSAASTVNGKKAFKYITSVVPSAADGANTFSVGTTNIIGLPIRSDTFADILVNYSSASLNPDLVTTSTGYTASVKTLATTTTGDVRGTYTLQTAASTGANRLFVRQTPALYNVGSIVGLYGVTQA